MSAPSSERAVAGSCPPWCAGQWHDEDPDAHDSAFFAVPAKTGEVWLSIEREDGEDGEAGETRLVLSIDHGVSVMDDILTLDRAEDLAQTILRLVATGRQQDGHPAANVAANKTATLAVRKADTVADTEGRTCTS